MKSQKQAQTTSSSAASPSSRAAAPSSPSNADVQSEMPAQGNDTGMPDTLKSGMESLSGFDLSDVRVHSNSSEPAEIGASAFAQGNDIHLGAGAEDSLPHEAWHVVQQKQGRVKPTTQIGDTGVNSDASLESEADAMGAKALGGSVEAATGPLQSGTASGGVAQRDKADDIDAGIALARAVRAMMDNKATSVPGATTILAESLKDSTTKRINSLAKVIAGGNESIFNKRRASVISMADQVCELEATRLETRDDGHSLDRHGPQVTDDQLTERLETGIAPDGKMSPTKGLSTKFATNDDYLLTREKSVSDMNAALKATKNHVKTVLNLMNGRKGKFEQANTALSDAAPNAKKALVAPKEKAQAAYDTAKNDVKILVDGIGQDNAAGFVPIKFQPNQADPFDWIVLYNGYDVVVDHGTSIGKGYKGDDTTAVHVPDVTDPTDVKKGHHTWADHAEVPIIQVTRSGMEAPAKGEQLMKDHTPASWKIYQHFPVQETPGIKV